MLKKIKKKYEKFKSHKAATAFGGIFFRPSTVIKSCLSDTKWSPKIFLLFKGTTAGPASSSNPSLYTVFHCNHPITNLWECIVVVLLCCSMGAGEPHLLP